MIHLCVIARAVIAGECTDKLRRKGGNMSTLRSMQRQKAREHAERLHKAGKGDKNKLFEILWKGGREYAEDKKKSSKQDEDIEKLLKRARAVKMNK